MLHLRLRSASALAISLSLVACGGKPKKHVERPVEEEPAKPAPPPAPETEADREAKRLVAAQQIVPAGSSCLPAALKADGAPQLELAAVGADAVICAIDADKDRLLGPIGCWKVDLAAGGLAPMAPTPLPGHGFDVKLDGDCARGYCLPKGATPSGDGLAHIAWNLDSSKVVVLAGSSAYLFDATTKELASSFAVNGGDKGVSNEPTQVFFVGDEIFVEGSDAGPFAAVWAFKADGTALGAIESLGGGKDAKPISVYGGSFSILDKARVGVAEQGLTTMTTYEVDTGKRSKLVRRITKPGCKPAELDAYWLSTGDKIAAACKASLDKTYTYLVGAQLVAGAKNYLALLRGPRIGELAVLDAKTLAEKKSIQLPWCPADGGGGDDSGKKPAKPKPTSKEDPDAGNE